MSHRHPFSWTFPVTRKGATFTTLVKSDDYLFVAVVAERRWFRKPSVRVEFHSEEMLVDETAIFASEQDPSRYYGAAVGGDPE